MTVWIFLMLALAAGILLYLGLFVISSPKSKHVSTKRAGGGYRTSLDRALIARQWAEIQAKLNATGGAKSAVMDADKLLDYVLSAKTSGETMGDRLKSGGHLFSDLNGVWRAHKLRNHLAHDINPDFSRGEVNDAIRQFERGLRDLGAL